MARTFEITELLGEAGRLRELALRLVGDRAQAEDLVQDTWLAVLRRPPRDPAAPGPWLARVVRNLARNALRERTRRAAREEHAHEEQSHPSPEALAREAEAQRLLAEAVTRLAEPLRAVVVLRYFQGLDSAAAAARLGLPASTVRTRLQRALEELRADLDRRFEGGREGWCALLAPLATRARPAASGASAPAAVAAAGAPQAALVGWGLGLTALVAAGALSWRSASAARETASVASLAPDASAASSGGRATPDPAGPGAREAQESLPSRAPATGSAAKPVHGAPDDPSAAAAVSGTLLLDGRAPEWPIELALEPNGPSTGRIERARPAGETRPVAARSAGEALPRQRVRRESIVVAPEQGGRFAFEGLPPDWSGRLVVSGFSFADGESSLALDAPRTGLVLALVSGPEIVGRILDPEGRPVPGLAGTYELRLGRDGEEAHEVETSWPFTCIADGRFRIPSRGQDDWASLTLLVEAEGHGYLRLETPRFAPARGTDLGELALEPARVLAFTVRDPHGAPIEGAFARVDGLPWSTRSASTGTDGRGTLAFAPERATDVRVSAAGFADRVLPAEPSGPLEAVLEPLAILDLRLVGALAAQAERVRLTAERAAFVWDESGWDERAKLQVELGGVHPGRRRGPASGSQRREYEFQRQFDGRYLLVGLVPDVPLTVEVLDADGRVLALRTTSVASQTRATLELGDPSTHAEAPVSEPRLKRRSSVAAPR